MIERFDGETIRLGISTCPNDTFAFHGLLEQKVNWRGLKFEVELLDIQQLNLALFQQKFDVAKASFHAALRLGKSYFVLPSGSALGFGVGPLLLAAKPRSVPLKGLSQITWCPGEHTTASLLFQIFYPGCTQMEQVVFSDIMPGLQRGATDFGVCIHEGRFTWQRDRLSLVEDLGTRWEIETNSPLPLGGILASKNLPTDAIERVQRVIRDSIDYAMDHPSYALPTMRKHAQEFDDEVLMHHVHLYVNDWTKDLGPEGKSSLAELSRLAAVCGITPNDVALEIFRS